MKRSLCCTLIGLVCFTFTGVNAENNYLLTYSSSNSNCPNSWNDVKIISNVKKGQKLASNEVISGVDASIYLLEHDGIYVTEGIYNVNYYIATEDSDGNIQYELYSPVNQYCTYGQYSDAKYVTTYKVPSKDSFSLENQYLILPTVNGKSVKWIYSSDDESSFDNINSQIVLDSIGDSLDLSQATKSLKKYIKSLNENEIHTIKTSVENSGVVNFIEDTEQEAGFKIKCTNTTKDKYECSLVLDYKYSISEMKISLEGTKIELNNLTAKNGWKISSNNKNILVYQNDPDDEIYINNIEIAIFSVDYSGNDSQTYVEENIAANVIELTNSLGTFSEESIINESTYKVDEADLKDDTEVQIDNEANKSNSTDSNISTENETDSSKTKPKNGENGDSNIIYFISFGLIAVLAAILVFLKKFKINKIN